MTDGESGSGLGTSGESKQRDGDGCGSGKYHEFTSGQNCTIINNWQIYMSFLGSDFITVTVFFLQPKEQD